MGGTKYQRGDDVTGDLPSARRAIATFTVRGIERRRKKRDRSRFIQSVRALIHTG